MSQHPRPQPSPPQGLSDSVAMALVEHEAATRELLEQLVDATRSGPELLAVSEKAPAPMVEADFPYPGSTRWLIPRRATGGEFGVGNAAPAQLLADNPNRIGGRVVNVGTKRVDLFLADTDAIGSAPSRAAAGRVGLEPGEAWDLRLGNLLWSGSLSGLCGEGETNVTVVEV